MNLLYCGNAKAFDGILLSLISILRNTGENVEVYLLTMDLREHGYANCPITNEQTSLIQKLLSDYGKENKVHLIDATSCFKRELGNSVNLTNFYTPYCMLRLLADLITELPQKILYLDTDTIALSDIKELYEINVDRVEYAGCIDYLGKIFKHPHYINSGVLLYNLKMMKETGLLVRARELCKDKRMAFPDQDALNKASNRLIRLPRRFNEQRIRKKDTVIRHFCKSLRIFPYIHTVNIKPWEKAKVDNVLKITYLNDFYGEFYVRVREKREETCQKDF